MNPANRYRRILARLVMLLPVLVIVVGCSTWGNLFGDKDKDEGLPDEPADRLYNEGLYLLNEKKEYGEKVRGSRSPASLFRVGAQSAADVRLRLL